MPTFLGIADPADPRVSDYLNVRERDLVGRQGRFIAEGAVVLRTLLSQSRYGVELGFKWLSQHLERGGCDGRSEAAFGSVRARRAALAWSALCCAA